MRRVTALGEGLHLNHPAHPDVELLAVLDRGLVVSLAHGATPPELSWVSRICRRCRAIARFRRNEISQSNGRVKEDLGCIANDRTTRVAPSICSNSHVS